MTLFITGIIAKNVEIAVVPPIADSPLLIRGLSRDEVLFVGQYETLYQGIYDLLII